MTESFQSSTDYTKGNRYSQPRTSEINGVETKEDPVTKTVEQVTTRIPSITFLGFALGAMGVSAALQFAGYKEGSRFIGQWVPTILIMGTYNKLVKLHGSEGENAIQ